MPYSPTNPTTGGFQLTPPTGLNDTATYQSTPTSEATARQQFMDMYWQIMNEINKPTLSAAAYAQYNRLINGGFAVNQRVVSGTVTLAAGAYGHDRWKAGAAGCTYTFATVNNITTITITAGSLVQVIEGINLVSGTHTLSWTGTAQGKIGAGVYSASGITGAATGGTNLSIEFNVGTLSKVQFNAGDQALPFQPRSFAEELALCQRYYEKSYNIGINPAAASSPSAMYAFASAVNVIAGFRFKVQKRTAPTITIYSPSGTQGKAWNNLDADISSGGVAGDIGDSGCRYVIFSGSGLTVNGAYTFHFTADAEI
jgi:hypothetical protein